MCSRRVWPFKKKIWTFRILTRFIRKMSRPWSAVSSFFLRQSNSTRKQVVVMSKWPSFQVVEVLSWGSLILAQYLEFALSSLSGNVLLWDLRFSHRTTNALPDFNIQFSPELWPETTTCCKKNEDQRWQAQDLQWLRSNPLNQSKISDFPHQSGRGASLKTALLIF